MRDDRANGHADIKPEVKKSKSNVSVLWISRTTFSLFQFGVVTLLIILGIIHYVYAGIYGGDFITKLTEVFDVYGENSLSNAFAVFNLLISSMLSFVVYLHSKGHRESISVNWLILSIILLVLSIDDAAALHERSRGLGLFETWRVFAALCGFAMLLFFIPFLLKLDRRTATLLVLSGAIFATGVIFLPGTAELEYFGGWKAHNEVDFAHQALKILEEA